MQMLKRIMLTFVALMFSHVAMAEKETQTLILNLKDKVHGIAKVPVEISYPNKGDGPFPLIITQHGSTRDGHIFKGRLGKSDEYSRRLMMAAVQQGYAVAVIDAFYKKGLKGSDKQKFPKASQYGLQLAKRLAKDPKIDAKNISYTGFSYGAAQVNRMLLATQNSKKGFDFAALVAAEPGCNAFVEPSNYPVPYLVLKGGESHYQSEPCEIMISLYKNAGMNISLKEFPKSNHFFSHNGQVVKGVAVNGCPDNPMIITKKGPVWHKDGTRVKKSERSACFTKTGGKGKSREDLDDAVAAVINFITEHRR